jgi:hypothetical protein
MGSSGLTASTMMLSPALMTGAKSFMGSNGIDL